VNQHQGEAKRGSIDNHYILLKPYTMAFDSDYKEAFTNEPGSDIPVKVHIIAPSTLPEGYIFEAEIGAPGAKKTISVEVVSVTFAK
jgi:hypothetical protein